MAYVAPTTERRQTPARRCGYSSGALEWEAVAKVARTVHAKSEGSRQRIEAALRSNFLFAALSSAQLAEIIDAMEPQRVPKDTVIIRQGDEGDYYYVIDEGEVVVHAPDRRDGPRRMGPGEAFGELALLFNQPRTATVTTLTDVVLMRVDRLTFRRTLMQSAVAKTERYAEFLSKISIFESLDKPSVLRIIDSLSPRSYAAGEVIVQEGDEAHEFFLIEEGTAEAVRRTGDCERLLRELHSGDYFGEVALVQATRRTATVRAKGPVRCLVMDRVAFERIAEPCLDKLTERFKIYL